MRIRKLSVVALVAVAVSLSLTACEDDVTTGSSGATTAAQADAGSTTAAQADPAANGKGTAATDDAGSATSGGSGTAGGGACQTANLTFGSPSGPAQGEVLISLTNSGSGTCTMHGFPGVDLKGKDGTVSAERSHVSAPDVTLRPGETTRFTLHVPPNNTGGSGVTFTGLVVTPPNETHSHTLSLAVNLPVGDGSGPTVTVDPVGAAR